MRRHPRHGLLPALVAVPAVLLVRYGLQSWSALAERRGRPGLLLARWASNWLWLGAALVVLLLRFPTGAALGRGRRGYGAVVLVHVRLLGALFAAHVSAVLGRLGVTGRAEAVARARDAGMGE